MDATEIQEYIQNIPDDVLSTMSFSVPWQYDPDTADYTDPDKRRAYGSDSKDDPTITRDVLQGECWKKAQESPHSNTAIRGLAGRLAGRGFEVSCEIPSIQDLIEEIEDDHRNRLFNNYFKYALRGELEGELYICLTCHRSGFIEVDFVDPGRIDGLKNGLGIIFHPNKANMPLIYNIKPDPDRDINSDDAYERQIPSINIARFPDLLDVAAKDSDFNAGYLQKSRTYGSRFRNLRRFNQFIVAWDKSWVTKRNIGHLRTILRWLNLYENLKNWEADYKKSASAYLWVFKITDAKAFKIWIGLSDEDKRKTMIGAKKTPGSSVILPPGIDLEVKNPQLPKVSDEDRDILRMITAGLGEPEDITTSSAQGPFASVKASRGPFSERLDDEIESWEKFVRYDLWGGIFFLRSKISGFPETFKVRECIGYKQNGDPKFGSKKKRPEKLIEINFPLSEIVEIEKRTKAFLGVKHGPMTDTLGIPKSIVARRLGLGNYRKLRLEYETEKDRYPELPLTLDAESIQETKEAEPKRPKPTQSKPNA